jgi:hypothetical protein
MAGCLLGVATLPKYETVEIGTGETQRSVRFHSEETPLTQFFARLREHRVGMISNTTISLDGDR